MPRESSNYGRKLGQHRGGFGQGQSVNPADVPQFVPVRFSNFQAGYNVADSMEDISANASSNMLDMEVNKRDSLLKAPGTALFELFVGKTPTQIALHVGLQFKSELVLFDPPYVGFKHDTATVWVSTSIYPGEVKPYAWTTFGDFFVFGNGNGYVRSHEFGTDTVVDQPLIPNGSAFASIAARLFVGGAVIAGVREPMAMAWSGVGGYDKFDYVTDLGSGFELLVNDQASGDAIVAVRAMGLDVAAIICRRSVWIGRRTGDLDRPLDFQPRVSGKGCVAEPTARTVYGGVMYLGEDGVEFFDGNNATKVSAAIDPELLPLDMTRIGEYSATYNPMLQRYYLFTPSGTYVYEILFQRWYKRSLIARGGVPFALHLTGLAWDQSIGTWDEQNGTWSSMIGDEGDPIMTFLGIDSDFVTALHQEIYSSYVNFGYPVVPTWASKVGEGNEAIQLVSTNAIKTRYRGGGTLDLYMPDVDGAYEKVNTLPYTLPVTTAPHLVQTKSLHTGLGAGVQIKILSGTPEISEIEIGVQARGVRVDTPYPFAPREYQADF